MDHRGKTVGRLVKADVPVAANAQKLQVHPAQALDQSLIPAALLLQVRSSAIGKMGVLPLEIHPAEQVVVHKKPVAVGVIPPKAAVLIQVHCAHLGKVQTPRPVGLHQALIGSNGAGTCGKAQNTPGLQQHLRPDQFRSQGAHFPIISHF